MTDILETIIKDLLLYYLSIDDIALEKYIDYANTATKERIEKIKDLEVWIYSNDHNPPHFHVKSNDLKIDAKFTIEQFKLISGEISSKHLKRIKAFYESPKGKCVLAKIWNKRLQ